jgi:hypothetical protein
MILSGSPSIKDGWYSLFFLAVVTADLICNALVSSCFTPKMCHAILLFQSFLLASSLLVVIFFFHHVRLPSIREHHGHPHQ